MVKFITRAVIVLLVCSTLSACSGRARIPLGVVPAPVKVSAVQKNQAYAAFNQQVSARQLQPIEKGPSVTRTERVFRRIERAAGYSAGTISLKVVNAGEQVNAVTYAGAHVVVYQKLLERVHNDDELAVVLGHEFGHILGKHFDEDDEIKSRQDNVNMGSTILGALASAGMRVAGLPMSNTVGRITSSTSRTIGTGAFVRSYDRDQEYEADQIGLLLMAKAGYDPKVAPGFWKRAQEVFGSDPSSFQAFFGTHPAPSDRSEELEKSMPFAQREFRPTKS